MTMNERKSERYKIDFSDPEVRARYKKVLKKWHKRLEPLTDSIRRSQRITADDLNIRVGPCYDDD